jgi:hypothetical protein
MIRALAITAAGTCLLPVAASPKETLAGKPALRNLRTAYNGEQCPHRYRAFSVQAGKNVTRKQQFCFAPRLAPKRFILRITPQ